MLLDSLLDFGEIIVKVVKNNRLLRLKHLWDWIDVNVVEHDYDPQIFTPTSSGTDFESDPSAIDRFRC
jgi:hypothetical protein